MVFDDSKWFAAGKRIRAELEPMVDEMRRINCAVSVESEMERLVIEDIANWACERGDVFSPDIIKAYWNERLN